MPHDKTHETLARQWDLLKLVPSRGEGKTASELTGALADCGFDVTKRTVERDLLNLSRLFPLVCDDNQKPFRWCWEPNYSMTLPGLSVAESLSLRLLEGYLRPILPVSLLAALTPRFQEAKSRLNALAGSNQTVSWPEKVRVVQPSLPLHPPEIDPIVLEQIQDALLYGVQFDATYCAHSGTKELRLHPLSMVQRGPVSYLVAKTFSYPDVRLYALHRFKRVSTSTEAIIPPEDFDIDEYIAQGGLQFDSGEFIVLKAKISPELAMLVTETPLSNDMAVKDTGDGHMLTATVPDTWQLRWWILSQGPECIVIAPAELRDEIADRIRRTKSAYSDIST